MDGGGEARDAEQRAGGRSRIISSAGIMRRWRWVVWPTVAALVASSAFVLLSSPRYTGVAKVLLEDQESYYTRPDKASGLDPAATIDPEAVQSQAEAVASTIWRARRSTGSGSRRTPSSAPIVTARSTGGWSTNSCRA